MTLQEAVSFIPPGCKRASKIPRRCADAKLDGLKPSSTKCIHVEVWADDFAGLIPRCQGEDFATTLRYTVTAVLRARVGQENGPDIAYRSGRIAEARCGRSAQQLVEWVSPILSRKPRPCLLRPANGNCSNERQTAKNKTCRTTPALPGARRSNIKATGPSTATAGRLSHTLGALFETLRDLTA